LDGIAIDHFVMDEFHSSNTSWMANAIDRMANLCKNDE
jgi:hypothetical protein